MANVFWLNQLNPENNNHTELKEKYQEWRQLPDNLGKKKDHFWKWLQENHTAVFSNAEVQAILALKNERQSQLRTIIRNSAKFDRNTRVIGLSETYWLEAIDPQHRKNDQLLAYFSEWKQTEKILSFWDWLTEKYPTFNNAKSVQYLSEQQRKEYAARIANGVIIVGSSSTELYDTSSYKGKQPGYAAFAMDTQGILYLGQHIIGDVHHSSFLAGQKVVATGMIKIKRGKIKEINNSSGHYKPELDHIQNFLRLLHERNELSVIAKDCKVIITDYSVKYYKFIDTIANWLIKSSNSLLIKFGHYLTELNTKSHKYKISDLLPPIQNIPQAAVANRLATSPYINGLGSTAEQPLIQPSVDRFDRIDSHNKPFYRQPQKQTT